MLKGLLVQLLNESQNPSLVEQIFILILNVGSGTHRSKMLILEWEEFMKLTVERLRVSHTTKFYSIELPMGLGDIDFFCVSRYLGRVSRYTRYIGGIQFMEIKVTLKLN